MTRWKLITGLALVFIFGALAGSIGTGFYFKHKYPPRITNPEARKAFILEKLSRELSLTPDQKNKIGEIIQQTEGKRHEFFVKHRLEIEQSMIQIRGELNADQQKKFDALREDFEKRRRARERESVR